ncbi:MAG TPA: MarR family transcriptional regulator [Gemmatimonadaceae bacterium]|jgi:DNA-binding MarR family transcriptional regulator|nr:MarR family transcriptional regulator [Gemmatimonadaceae bacterium]
MNSMAPPTEAVMWSLIHAAKAVEQRMESALELVELSSPKFAVLTILVDANDALTLSELAAKSSCVRSNMTQLIDRLEADGLVRRIDDPHDRRSVRAELTARGRERQAAGAQRMEVVQKELADLLPADVDLAALCRTFGALS